MERNRNFISSLGQCIQDYDLLQEIGKGNFAEVFKAKCKRTGELVAIKRIHATNISKQLEKRIREEINIHSNLRHESILQLFAYFRDDKYMYIVLELCHQDLNKYVQSKPEKRLDESEARNYFIQILSGMLYLKERNIIHRDLKLSNTLLLGTSVKIADFGLATNLTGLEDNRGPQTFCGTPEYICPEVISRRPQTAQLDVWALGIILYTMLVGKTPFNTKCAKETMKKVDIGLYDFKSYLSQDSIDLIKKCLQKVPEDRISLADIRNHRFLTPISDGMNAHSRDSGFQTVSIGGNDTHHSRVPLLSNSYNYGSKRMMQSNIRNNYQRSLSPPVRMRSSPEDLSKKPYVSNYVYKVPSLMPPPGAPRSARSNGSSVEYNMGSSGAIKPIHYAEMYNNPHVLERRIPNVNVRDAGSGIYYQSSSARGSYHDNGYTSQRNSMEENVMIGDKVEYNDPHEQANHPQSCCSVPSQQSCCERKNICQQHMPVCNSDVSDMNRMKTSQGENYQSSMKGFSCPGTMLHNSSKEKPPMLSAVRLKKIREVKEFSVLSILDKSEVCIEYIKKKNSKMKVIEVWKVSSNGNDIVVYRPNGKNGIDVGESPPKEQGDISRYTYDSLPEKYWKKYSHAHTFAENVKAKTRKIMDRNEEPKACLMENGNVQAEFKNGYKFVFYTKYDPRKGNHEGKVDLTKGNRTYTYNADACSFDGKDAIMYEKCIQIRDYLLCMENYLTKRQITIPDRPQFPCFFGPRPENNVKSTSKDTLCSLVYSDSNKENVCQKTEVSRRNVRI